MRTIAISLVLALTGAAALADKISGQILLHRELKRVPEGVAEADHLRSLRAQGFAATAADAERCAIYVDDRLSEGEIATLEREGLRFDAGRFVPAQPDRHPHGFHVALVPYAALDLLRADPRVVRVASLEPLTEPNNNLSRAATGADDVHAGNGVGPYDGSGIKLAIADSGLDLGHPDLPVPVEAFDMTDGTGPGSWGGDVSNTVIDHGTHVTGCAVASGDLSATNVGNGGGDYRGTAPGVSFHFYKIGDDVSGGTTFADMIEAVQRAAAVGVDVFSMSYGGFSSEFMDGSSSVCQAIDAAVAGGMTVFTSAGNKGNLTQHDFERAPPGDVSTELIFKIGNAGGATPRNGTNQLRIVWRDGNPGDANVDLEILNLGAGEGLFEASSASSPRGTESKLYLFSYSVPPGENRDYRLRFNNGAAGGATPLVQIYRVSGFGAFDDSETAYTIVHPGLCDGTIAVGAWTQRDTWTNYIGEVWTCCDLVLGAFAEFSSRGPRVDGRRKPELLAPGASHVSLRDSTFSTLATRFIDNDGFGLDGSGPADYYTLEGTSQAAPTAAAAAALVLEAGPGLSPSGVRHALQSTAANAAAPDDDVGHGLIDVLAAIQNLPAPGTDIDGDHRVAPEDCDDDDPTVWATPGEVTGVRFVGPAHLEWDEPAEPGAVRVGYDTVRSADPADFVSAATCVETDGDDRMSVDGDEPGPGDALYYLVLARNDCAAGRGSAGNGSDGGPRAARSCP